MLRGEGYGSLVFGCFVVFPNIRNFCSGKVLSVSISRDRIRALQKLESEGNTGLLNELVSVALADFPEKLRILGDALRGNRREALRFGAHSLSGSAAAIGAYEIQSLAGALEAWARKSNSTESEAAETLQRLRVECALAVSELKRILAELPDERTE